MLQNSGCGRSSPRQAEYRRSDSMFRTIAICLRISGPLEGRSHRIVTKSSNWLGQDLTQEIEVLFDRQAFSFNKLDCGLVCRHFPQLFSKNVDFIIVGSKSLDKTAVVYEVHKSGSQYIPNVTFAISELKNISSSVFSEQHRSSQI